MKNLFKNLALTMMLLIMSVPFIDLAHANTTQLDRVVAIVNKNVITQSEVNQQVTFIKRQFAKTKQTLPPEEVLRKQVLQHLIDVDLQMQIAKRANVKISNSQVKKAISDIAKRNGISVSQMRQKIEATGMTYKEYLANVHKEMLLAQLQQEALGSDIVITPAEVTALQKKLNHAEQANYQYEVKNILIPLPDSPTAQQVQATEQLANKLLAKIKSGTKFSKAALAAVAGQTAIDEGDLGWRNTDSLPEVFANRVVKMNVNQVSGPIRTSNGFHLIKLTGKKRVGKVTTVSQLQARQLLYQRKLSQALGKWIKKIRSEAYIQIINA